MGLSPENTTLTFGLDPDLRDRGWNFFVTLFNIERYHFFHIFILSQEAMIGTR